MKSTILSLSLLLAAGGTVQLSAENVALDGYYRIQNARDNGYVHVGGPFTVATNHTLQQAVTEPGSVFYVNAVQSVDLKGESAFRVRSLRSQGVQVMSEEPYTYQQFLDDLFEGATGSVETSIVHNITKLGFDHGYVNVGRAGLEFMIYFMGTYLNDVRYKGQENADVDLAALTDNFITTVADKINLNIYLQPVKTTEGADAYSLYYDIPDLQPAVDWYLNPDNKSRFEVGFEAMRKGLEAHGVSSGEYLDAAEVAEMRANGYDMPDKYLAETAEIGGATMYHVPYEKIFADKDLLFAWLKMNVIRLLDPERCPKITLKGIYLPSIGEKLREHRVTAQLISYFPRLNTGKRIYLISGLLSNGGVEGTGGTDYTPNGQFGFVSAESVAAGYVNDAAKWIVTPIDNNKNYFAVSSSLGSYYAHNSGAEYVSDEAEKAKRASENGMWTSIYLDFPVKQPEGVTFNTLTNDAAAYDTESNLYAGDSNFAPRTYNKQSGTAIYYYELTRINLADNVLPRMIPAIMIDNSGAAERVLEIAYNTQQPVYTLDSRSSMVVKDEYATIVQQAPAARISNASDGETGVHSVLKGTLLPVSTELMPNYGYDYDIDYKPAYSLNVKSGFNNRKLSENTSGMRANEAFLVAPFGTDRPAGETANVYIGRPADDTATAIDAVVVTPDDCAAKAVYDLQGRRVGNVVAGCVYIVDGIKVLAL